MTLLAEQLSWPSAVVLVAVIAFVGFFVWLVLTK